MCSIICFEFFASFSMQCILLYSICCSSYMPHALPNRKVQEWALLLLLFLLLYSTSFLLNFFPFTSLFPFVLLLPCNREWSETLSSPLIFSLKTFWTFCIYHCMQEIEKKANLNIFIMILVPVSRVLQLLDIIVRSFVSITINLFLSKEICPCQHNFIIVTIFSSSVAGIFLLLLLSYI